MDARLINSMVPALEIGLEFRKNLTDKDIFLHGNKNIFSSSLQLFADQPYYQNYPPHLPPAGHKNSSNTFPFPTLQFFSEAVHMDKSKITDISKYC